MTDQDRTRELRRRAADRSRRRGKREPGDLRKSLKTCDHCGRSYYAAFGGCVCGGNPNRYGDAA